MRKLKLDPEKLEVDTFAPVAPKEGEKGTVRGHISDYCPSAYGCTLVGHPTCSPDLCGGGETNDPRQRACVTPYVECGTDGWTCDYC
jgi:hypothetical protein